MTDEARQTVREFSNDQNNAENSTKSQGLGFQQVTSERMLHDLFNWQVAQGYDMPNADFSELAKTHLTTYFWKHLAGLSEYRYSQRPLRRRDDFSFVMLLTDLEQTQMEEALQRGLYGPLNRFFRTRREEWLRSGEFPRRNIADGIMRAVGEKWCIKMACTTCGSYRFRLLFLGEPDSRRVVRPKTQLTIERAKEVATALAELSEFDGKTKGLREPVMVMLYWIWAEFRDRAHSEVFPVLESTWSGDVLEDMKADFERQELCRARHRIRRREVNR